MNKCNENIKLGNEVYDFIDYVNDVGEESITDYLVWQWRKLNKKFNFLNVEKHTRHFENKVSGADFELELWILTKSNNLSFVFQAKKIIPDYNAYCSKLNYRNGGNRQIDVLINYAKTKNKLPFYLFFSPVDEDTSPMCNHMINKTALFMADAYTIDDITQKCKNKKLSKNTILEKTNPFHCLFCCPLTEYSLLDYIQTYFQKVMDNFSSENNKTPSYVYAILNNELGNETELIEKNKLNIYRNIGVLDLRDEDIKPNKRM